MVQQASPSVPQPAESTNAMTRINGFLDKYILPWPVKYLTNRITILGTLTLLIPLILLANVTVFVLAANSYLNVMSVVVSSTVLLYSTLSEKRDKEAAEQRDRIAAHHAALIEARALADHERIQQIKALMETMQREIQDHVNAELASIKDLMLDQINTLHAEALTDSGKSHDKLMAYLDDKFDSLMDQPGQPTTP
jgi:hypothetical protein